MWVLLVRQRCARNWQVAREHKKVAVVERELLWYKKNTDLETFIVKRKPKC
jgi:hypothetical protein